MTGWDWDHVDNYMTMPRLIALEEVWMTTPPAVLSMSVVAQANGLKRKSGAKKKKIVKNANVGSALELANALKGLG